MSKTNLDKVVKNLLKITMLIVVILAIVPAMAADMDHSGMNHSGMDHSKMNHGRHDKDQPVMLHDMSLTATSKVGEKARLKKLATMPVSGKAREGGYDGRYVMEPTDAAHALQTQCAQASRGLIMISNAEWSRCGGKPVGAANAPLLVNVKVKPVNAHTGHNM